MSYKPRRRSYALRAMAAACLGAVTFVAAACGSSGSSSSSSTQGSGSGSGSATTCGS